MTPAIWTSMRLVPLSDCLRALVADGWKSFEVSTEHLKEIDDAAGPATKIDQTNRLLEELGATMPQAHAMLRADVASPDEDRRAGDLATLRRHLEYCKALGVRNVVMHPGIGGGYTAERQRRQIIALNVANIRPLADQAGEAGMRIALENMEWMAAESGGGARRFGYSAQELVELVAAIDHPAVGIAIDTSHANIQRYEPLGVAETIRVFGRLICATHISDNDGTRDGHRIPGHGNIDWLAVMSAFRDIGYDGLFNLEIPGDKHSVPELLSLKSQHARRVAEWLVSLA